MDSTKKLYRSRHDSMIGGVCGGLGEYLGVDSTLVRVIFALLALMGGGGIVLYLVLWLVIPSDPQSSPAAKTETAETVIDADSTEPAPAAPARRRGRFRLALGLLILLAGALSFLDRVAPMPWFRSDLFWPLALIVIGFLILTGGSQR